MLSSLRKIFSNLRSETGKMFTLPSRNQTISNDGTLFKKWFDAKKDQLYVNDATVMWLCTGVGVGVLYFGSHLQLTPAWNNLRRRIRFMAFTQNQQTYLHRAIAKLTTIANIRKLRPSTHQNYEQVQRVVDKIVECNEGLKKLNSTWIVHILESKAMHASALPIGVVFITTGLLSATENDDQLAVFLSRELAHALYSHTAERLSYACRLAWISLTVVPILGIWAVVPLILGSGVKYFRKNTEPMRGTQIMTPVLSYDQLLENEADQIGLELCARACYDIRESTPFMLKLSKLNGENGIPNKDDEENYILEKPGRLTTHPSFKLRAISLYSVTPEAVQMRESCQCPSLPDLDPRTRLVVKTNMTQQELDSYLESDLKTPGLKFMRLYKSRNDTIVHKNE